jgi:hypothetical protein
MSHNNKQSSPGMSSKAAKILANPNSSDTAKSLAASVVSQSNSPKQTGAHLETLASKVLQSEKYSDTTKSLAASVLAQSNKER